MTSWAANCRDRVPFASYLFFRYPNPKTGHGEVRTPDQLLAAAADLKKRCGFTSHKLKGGVFPPDYELECYRALAASLKGDRFRFDPNGVFSTEQAIRFGQAIEGLNNDYLEDPVFGLNGMRRARQMIRVPLATNTVVVNFEQLAANALNPAVDVILLDTTFWGGIRPCLKAAGVCETFQFGVAVHSSGELGIQLATMLHLGAVLPNLTFAADAHYHHLTDDIVGGASFVTKTAPSVCRRVRAWASAWIAPNWPSPANFTNGSAAIPTIRIRCGPDGLPPSPTTAGAISRAAVRQKSRFKQARWRRAHCCRAISNSLAPRSGARELEIARRAQ